MIDTGPGIPPAIQERVWDVYFSARRDRAAAWACRRPGGSPRSTAAASTFETEPGKGTDFILRLPLGRLRREPPAPRRHGPRRTGFRADLSRPRRDKMSASCRDRATPPLNILVVEDDRGHAEIIAEVLEQGGHRCTSRIAGGRAWTAARAGALRPRRHRPAAAGPRRPGARRALPGAPRARTAPCPQCVVVTGYGTVEGAVHAMRAGALHYLQKPVDVGILRETIRSAARADPRSSARTASCRRRSTSRSPSRASSARRTAMQRVFDVMNQIVDTDATVLIRGESGTGKELVAQALHRAGPRRERAVHPAQLRGARRGRARERALRSREGRVHRRPRPPQGALRGGRRRHALPRRDRGHAALDPGAPAPRPGVRGDRAGRARTSPIQVDVRVIAATHRDLDADGRGGTLPRRPLLPPARRPDRAAAAARAPGRPARASPSTSSARPRERHGKPAAVLRARDPRPPHALRLAGQRPRAEERRRVDGAARPAARLIPPEVVPAYVRPADDGPDFLGRLSGVPLGDVERALIENTLARRGRQSGTRFAVAGHQHPDPLPEDQGIRAFEARTDRGGCRFGTVGRTRPCRIGTLRAGDAAPASRHGDEKHDGRTNHRHRPRHHEQRGGRHGGRRAPRHREPRRAPAHAQRRRVHRERRAPRRPGRPPPGGHEPRRTRSTASSASWAAATPRSQDEEKQVSYKIVGAADEPVKVEIRGKTYTPPEISRRHPPVPAQGGGGLPRPARSRTRSSPSRPTSTTASGRPPRTRASSPA